MSYPGSTLTLLTVLALACSPDPVPRPVDPARLPSPSLAVSTPAPGPTVGEAASAAWDWPLVPPPVVVRPFLAPAQPWLSGHRGVDLLAPGSGVQVRSPADGQVRFRGLVAGVEVLVVEHAGGLRSTFEPVSSTLAVGTRVGRGEAIGVVVDTPGHCPPRTCLHWGVLRGAVYLDPLSLVRRSPVRLLPLE